MKLTKISRGNLLKINLLLRTIYENNSNIYLPDVEQDNVAVTIGHQI